MSLKITNLRFQRHLPGANELIIWMILYLQEWLIEDRQQEEEEMQQLGPRLQRNFTV